MSTKSYRDIARRSGLRSPSALARLVLIPVTAAAIVFGSSAGSPAQEAGEVFRVPAAKTHQPVNAVLGNGTAPQGEQIALPGTEWRAVEIETAVTPIELSPIVRFGSDGTIDGFGGCNRFSGSYTFQGDMLRLGLLAATGIGCAGPVMSGEERFFAALQRVMRAALNGDDLLLLDCGGNVLLRLRPAAP